MTQPPVPTSPPASDRPLMLSVALLTTACLLWMPALILLATWSPGTGLIMAWLLAGVLAVPLALLATVLAVAAACRRQGATFLTAGAAGSLAAGLVLTLLPFVFSW